MADSFLSTFVRPALVLLICGTLVLGLFYPLAITGAAQLLFPTAANGSLIQQGNKVVGSALIAQGFANPRYFWGRPSAANYDAMASAGSQLGPENHLLQEQVDVRMNALKHSDPENKNPLPADMLTASASGLDPDISVAAASWQATRVAHARGMDPKKLRALIEKHTEGPQWGLYGEPRVNVLLLNLALDKNAE